LHVGKIDEKKESTNQLEEKRKALDDEIEEKEKMSGKGCECYDFIS